MIATPADITRAAALLEAGKLVAFPTETVYGLGADAENPQAVAAIYAAKGRPSNHPVIVHLAPDADVGYWTSDLPQQARQLIAAFWPGPLTLIVKRAAHIPDCVSGGQDTVGLRCPSHPVAQALLRAFKGGQGGVAAPSANKFGHVSPTTAAHVIEEFGEHSAAIAAILDGGQSEVGIESTIVDMSRLSTHGPVLLRPGHISAQQIAGVIGVLPRAPDLQAPRASGTLDAHYAPQTPVVQVEGSAMLLALHKLADAGRRAAVIHYTPGLDTAAQGAFKMANEATPYAHDLYAALRDMDHAGADIILVETPPLGPEWQGINDRLRRAAHDSAGKLAALTNS